MIFDRFYFNSLIFIRMTVSETVALILIGAFFLFVIVRLNQKIRDRVFLCTVTKRSRGTVAERELILKLKKHGIPPQTIFHDLYLRKHNGKYSQIDLVAVTNEGILVFEVKDFSGWIFGNGNHPQWTKVLAYGKEKYRFYNPVMQNNRHVSDLKNHLKHHGSIPFYSIIVFYGNCVLKDISFVPEGTFLVKPNRIPEVLEVIRKSSKPVFFPNKEHVLSVLAEAVKNGESVDVQNQHIENINDMLGKDRIFN